MAFLATGCGDGAEHTRLELAPLPFGDGEETIYDVESHGELQTEAFHDRWHRRDDGWALEAISTRRGHERHARVVVNDEGRPLRAVYLSGEHPILEVHYDDDGVRIDRPAVGESTLEHRPDAIENASYYQLVRALPLEDGHEQAVTLVLPEHDTNYDITLQVSGPETFETPAGAFEAWRVTAPELGPLHSFVASDPPHLFLGRERESSGTRVSLRRYRVDGDADWQGAEPAPSEPPEPPQPPELDVAHTTIAVFVQFPLMILLPLILGLVARRKLGVTFWAFWIGGLTFVASQVVHIPLNWGLGLIGTPRFVALWPRPAIAVVAGLSAGLCEELARYILMRWVLRKPKWRGWSSSVMLGVGHGGVEAMIFGNLALLSFINVLAVTLFIDDLGLPPETYPELQAGARMYWDSPVYYPALAGLERMGAMGFHVGASVLVMRAVTRKNLLYLGLAILIHAAVDGTILYQPELGTLGLSAVGAVVGLAMAGLVFALRERPAEVTEASSSQPPDPGEVTPHGPAGGA